jgi:hypothetical protein
VGASNALAAFRLYGGKIPPTALNVLLYMALVALDRDDKPHYWEGHEALAVHCLGRDETSIDDSDLRAVRRAITPLFDAGAITVARHSSGRDGKKTTASYRLHLVTPAQDGKRPVDKRAGTDPAPDEKCPAPDVGTGRKVAEHRTENGRAPDGFRPAKEYEEDEEREEKQEYSLLSSDSVPVGARKARNGPEEVASVRMIASPLMTVVPDDPGTSAAEKPKCRYGSCPGRDGPLDADGYHAGTCAYLVTIKPPSSGRIQARVQPEASTSMTAHSDERTTA